MRTVNRIRLLTLAQCPECTREPSRLWVTTRGAIDAVVLSGLGYVLSSVVPVLIVGGIVWRHAGWFAVIENADNMAVVAAAAQAALVMVRRAATRRRRVPDHGWEAHHGRSIL